MKVLLVYPRYPDTFWSFKYALKFISKKASYPPLGLLTVAALLPGTWERRLVDLNVDALRNEDIGWADYVFISAMEVQRPSVGEIVRKVKARGKKIVAGGPLFTISPDGFPDIDHLVFFIDGSRCVKRACRVCRGRPSCTPLVTTRRGHEQHRAASIPPVTSIRRSAPPWPNLPLESQ